ncbi:exported hypothetical protein [Candidatus Zixiibacteriota bacterium]|nr:exported hypothetical protein [candidate division Zixibacteria bacterium]
MIKSIFWVPFCLLLLTSSLMAQEVVISDFPTGVGGSVKTELFKPYLPQIKAIADTLHKYPLARAIVTGGADGTKYRQNNDALNPGLALGRAHVLRNLLITEFRVDSTQIIIQSTDDKFEGEQYRFAGIRIDRTMESFDSRLADLEKRPPLEKHIVEIPESTVTFVENFGLRLGGGLSSSPFGAIPLVTGSLTWRRIIFVEALVGHTFWKSTFSVAGSDLSTRRRLAGADVIVYPFDRLPLGFVGGWVRIEEISQLYYQYVRMSEGPLFGLRYTPVEFLSLTGCYNPSRHRLAGNEFSHTDNDQFMLSIMAHKTFGGER